LEPSYHARFEIPYIFLTQADQVTEISKRQGGNLTPTVSRTQLAQVEFDVGRGQSFAESNQMLPPVGSYPGPDEQLPAPATRRLSCMADGLREEHYLSINDVADSSNVVKLGVERLNQHPGFFNMREIPDIEACIGLDFVVSKGTLVEKWWQSN
jgi:hypothetical protein